MPRTPAGLDLLALRCPGQLGRRSCLYDDEAAALHELHHPYLAANGLREAGLHHEIYLSDPRRTAPEKLRTVLRQPVQHIGE
ncbi:GyrI-like domain-containing protein [Streptomyces sp. NPDC055078]